MIRVRSKRALKNGYLVELHGDPFCSDVEHYNPFRVNDVYATEFRSVKHNDVTQYVGRFYENTVVILLEALPDETLAEYYLEGYIE